VVPFGLCKLFDSCCSVVNTVWSILLTFMMRKLSFSEAPGAIESSEPKIQSWGIEIDSMVLGGSLVL
jgi:hypothetical protein